MLLKSIHIWDYKYTSAACRQAAVSKPAWFSSQCLVSFDIYNFAQIGNVEFLWSNLNMQLVWPLFMLNWLCSKTV